LFLKLLFFDAVAANAVILNVMSLNKTGETFLSFLINKVLVVHPDVQEGVAFSAYKMRMGFHMSVKPVGAVGCNLYDLAQINQKSKIPVNGSQADIGKLLPHVHINGIRSRVVIAGHQEVLDGFPLAAVFQCWHKNLLSIMITITVSYILAKKANLSIENSTNYLQLVA